VFFFLHCVVANGASLDLAWLLIFIYEYLF